MKCKYINSHQRPLQEQSCRFINLLEILRIKHEFRSIIDSKSLVLEPVSSADLLAHRRTHTHAHTHTRASFARLSLCNRALFSSCVKSVFAAFHSRKCGECACVCVRVCAFFFLYVA